MSFYQDLVEQSEVSTDLGLRFFFTITSMGFGLVFYFFFTITRFIN